MEDEPLARAKRHCSDLDLKLRHPQPPGSLQLQQASGLFNYSMLKAGGLYILGSRLRVGLLMLLESNPFSERILSPELLALLLVGFAGFHGFNAYTTYARVRWGGGFGPISLTTTSLMVLGFLLSTTEGTKQLIWILSGTSWAAFILSISLSQLRKRRR